MRTAGVYVPEVVREIITRNRSIYECMKMDVINYTALAVKIQSDVEKTLGNSVNLNTIVVAIKRYADSFDAFPTDGTQWDDWDGDGYGDNFSGTNPDSCPNQVGTSTLRVSNGANQTWYGCTDSDSVHVNEPDLLQTISRFGYNTNTKSKGIGFRLILEVQ